MAIAQVTKTGASKDTISAAWNAYNATVTAILTEHAASGAHGAITATSVATTTISALTSLTPAGNLDIGAYSFRAQNLIADALTSGRVVLTTTNGQLTSDSDITFSDDTLTVTKLNALTLAAVATGFTIAGGTTSKTLTLDANLTASYLADITSAEADQIEAIGTTTISAAQWGYVGAMNHGRSVFLTTALTDAAFDGDAFSDGGALLDLSAFGTGCPAGIEAVLIWMQARDSGSSGAACAVHLGLDAAVSLGKRAMSVSLHGAADDSTRQASGWIPCTTDGDIYYKVEATGTDTLDLWIYIFGYVLGE